jgi:membrane protein YdbS with pleckstrin-like domain
LPVSEDLARRSGWITFAGVIALVAGGYNGLSGIAALADDDTLADRATEVLYGIDLTAWGWFWLIVGVVQLVTGVLILGRNIWGLWFGVAIACVSAFMTVFVMFVFPLWAIAVLALDFLVLYGLLTRSDEFT